MTSTYKIIISIFVLGLLACGEDPKPQPTDENPIQVKTQTVKAMKGSSFSFSGAVSASQASTLKTRHAGYVNNILVEVGDEVQNNQLLIQIDSDELNAQTPTSSSRRQSSPEKF